MDFFLHQLVPPKTQSKTHDISTFSRDTDVFDALRPFEDLDELDQLEHDLIHARGDVDEVQHKSLDSFLVYLYWLVGWVGLVVVGTEGVFYG